MTPQEQYEHLVETVKGYNPAAGFDQIRAAYEFADTHHAGQNRKDGSPFITHPLAVAQIVAEELHLDTESIVAGPPHDTRSWQSCFPLRWRIWWRAAAS